MGGKENTDTMVILLFTINPIVKTKTTTMFKEIKPNCELS